jgi:hypothetical protein
VLTCCERNSPCSSSRRPRALVRLQYSYVVPMDERSQVLPTPWMVAGLLRKLSGNVSLGPQVMINCLTSKAIILRSRNDASRPA